jgi:PPOX class probable F420-dependent enzyme
MSDPVLEPGADPALTVGRVLTDELRAWLLAELRYPVLAINSGDGPPNQSVMWFDVDADEPDIIVMNTMVRRLKYRLLQADPRVSLLVEDGLTWVAMRGTVELDADFDRGMEGIRALAVRYHADPDRYAGQERVVIRMRVEKVIFHER